MSATAFTEGEIELHIPAAGKPCKTWYKVFGDLASRVHRPLVALHGGPGVTHHYLLPLAELLSLYSIPVILYDQVGNGRSTHLPEKKGDGTFWNDDLFLYELDTVLAHFGIQDDYDLYGHSWGGMLGARHAACGPPGLKHLILANSPASMELWIKATDQLRVALPQETKDTLLKHESNDTTHEKEYEDAVHLFYARHLCRVKPMPEQLVQSFAGLTEDPTVYHTMNGPSEMFIVGTMKEWTVIDELHRIKAPTLLLNGYYDEAQDIVVQPFFDFIPRVKWFQFAQSSHMPHHEEKELFLKVVGKFLTA